MAGEPGVELYPDLRIVKQAMNTDMPQGTAGLPNQHWSDERLRASFHVEPGNRQWLVLARDSRDRIAGFTELTNHGDDANRAMLAQGDTVVLREHRGHGLGLALKVAATNRACADAPGMSYAETSNDASNRHMIAVNDQLGYRPVCRVETFVLPLATQRPVD